MRKLISRMESYASDGKPLCACQYAILGTSCLLQGCRGQLKSMFDEQIKDIEDNIDEMVMDGKRVVGLPSP